MFDRLRKLFSRTKVERYEDCVQAVAAVDGALLAATTSGVFRSEDGGVTFSDLG